MCRCQDVTAPQYLAVHWPPVSEMAPRQHLRKAASYQLTEPPHQWIIDGGWASAVALRSTWNSLSKRLRDPSFSISASASVSIEFKLAVLVYKVLMDDCPLTTATGSK